MLKHITVILLSLLLGCAHKVTVPEHPANDEINPDETDTDTDTEVLKDTDTQSPIDKYLSSPEVADVAPLPEEPLSEAEALGINPDDLSLAKALFKWKMKYDKGIWVECGVKYDGAPEIKQAAIEWAQAINAAHKNATYTLRNGKTTKVSRKEVIGVMVNESRFDRCAVGPHPRKFAYKKGILKRKSWHISHSLEELKQVFTHPSFQGRQADLGGGQIVVRVGGDHTPWSEIKNYLSVVPGVQIVFDEMKRRGEMYNTKTPSDRWPGSQKHTYYTTKALRNASLIYKYL